MVGVHPGPRDNSRSTSSSRALPLLGDRSRCTRPMDGRS
jgi:hypothetical protein